MVVLLVLALLASIAAPQVIKHLRKAKAETADIQIDALGASLDYFQLDMGRYPTQEEGLKALIEQPANENRWDGPYLKKDESLVDPWGRPYQYRLPGEHKEYDLFSLGADNKEGGDGENRDVGNW
jgi:general secretion pathway protein G